MATRERARETGPGLDARGLPRVRLICQAERCGREFWTSRPDCARFCSQACAGWACTRPGMPEHAARLRDRQRVRRAKLGRVCRWCQATDEETTFATITTMVCGACDRSIYRGSVCGKCKGPRASHGFCTRCDERPAHLVELLWIDATTERERRLWIRRDSGYFRDPDHPKARKADRLWKRRKRPRPQPNNVTKLPILTAAQRLTALNVGQVVLIVPTPVWLRRRL